MDGLLSQLIDRAAERGPDREAYRCHDERLTYEELAGRANRLAHLLADEGVRPGDRVGIHLPRCLESALAVHGILRAGAVFVPVDPHLPATGARHLIEDCGIRHLVTSRSQASTLAALSKPGTPLEAVIGPDADCATDPDPSLRFRPWATLDAFPAGSPPQASRTEHDLAYVMYSSGSTGRPKGIMHTHRSGLAYARLSAKTYDVQPEDRIANHSPLHFDMSTFGYFTSPCAGATTVLIPEAHTKVAASLSALISAERITIWYSVPLALIQLLLRGVLDDRDMTPLRWVLFGGEPFPVTHLRELMRTWPWARFSNVYGPAEVNQCTYYHVPPADLDVEGDEPIPIGKTWEDTEALVLDEDDGPIADGDVGELLICSPTMMRGYWGRPDLDEKAFFDAGEPKTFYRTGDLVRRRPDGNLHFLGRKDRQIKYRGHRLELDDVEHVLAMHAAVEEAAAFPVRVSGEIDHLAAAVILRAGAAVEEGELAAHASSVLAPYAVPARIEKMTSFPRTTSGKIDRRQLQHAAEGAVQTS